MDTLLGISGTKENIPHLPDGIFQRPLKLNCGEVQVQRAIAKMGRKLIPGRAGVTTDGVLNNKYRARCMGRGRCGRGCDLNAAFHSPAALIFPARDTGNLTVRPDSVVSEILIDDSTNKATGVRVIDRNTKETMDFKGRLVIVAASCLESTRLLLNSKSASRSNGAANSSGVVGHYFCEHVMGPGASGTLPSRVGTMPTNDDGRPQSTYIVRFRNVTDKHPGLHSRLRVPGRERRRGVSGQCRRDRRLRRVVQEDGPRQLSGAVNYGGFGEVLAAQGEPRLPRPRGEGRVGHPGRCGSTTRSATTRRRWPPTWPTPPRRCSAPPAPPTSRYGATSSPKAGRSTRWAPRAWATTRRRSVTNSFGQTHDIKNLFVVDGSIFVSASCQNPTWMIMALCWRAMDYVKEQMRAREPVISNCKISEFHHHCHGFDLRRWLVKL